MSEQATAPAAPAQAPTMIDQSAPAVIPVADPGRSFNDSIRAIASKTGVKADAPADVPTVQFIRDPAKAAVDAPGSGDLPPGSVPPVAAAPVEVPATLEPAGELSLDNGDITITAQRNADGTFKTKLDPNEKIDFVIKSILNADGSPKAFSKTLPEVVRMAKDSVALNQTVQKVQGELKTIQPEVEYYRANVEQWRQGETSLREQLEAQKALNLELLTAEDDLVIQRREQYAEQMTPAKQLERMRAEKQAADDLTARTARQVRHDTIAKSFIGSRIAPSLAKAETIVSAEAVAGKMTMITNDLTVNGVIPPANWPEMERRVNAPDGPFQTWLSQESAKRTTDTDATRKAREAAEALQRRAQAVVNADGRLMAPIGRAGPDSAPQLPKATTVQQVKDRLINRPLPQSMTGSG